MKAALIKRSTTSSGIHSASYKPCTQADDHPGQKRDDPGQAPVQKTENPLHIPLEVVAFDIRPKRPEGEKRRGLTPGAPAKEKPREPAGKQPCPPLRREPSAFWCTFLSHLLFPGVNFLIFS